MLAYVPTHWWQHVAFILGHIKFVVLIVYTVVVYDAQNLCGSLNSPMGLETYWYTNIHYSLLHFFNVYNAMVSMSPKYTKLTTSSNTFLSIQNGTSYLLAVSSNSFLPPFSGIYQFTLYLCRFIHYKNFQ